MDWAANTWTDTYDRHGNIHPATHWHAVFPSLHGIDHAAAIHCKQLLANPLQPAPATGWSSVHQPTTCSQLLAALPGGTSKTAAQAPIGKPQYQSPLLPIQGSREAAALTIPPPSWTFLACAIQLTQRTHTPPPALSHMTSTSSAQHTGSQNCAPIIRTSCLLPFKQTPCACACRQPPPPCPPSCPHHHHHHH